MTLISWKIKEALSQLKQATLDFLELQQGLHSIQVSQQLVLYLADLAHLTLFIQIGKSNF